MGAHLIIIDPQNDFVDPTGSLYVKGAEQDAQNLSKFIDKIGNKLDDIHVTLDTHHYFDIAHPSFWLDSSGKHPNPFSIITLADFKDGKFRASIPSMQQYAEYYLESLEKNKRYVLCIWPPHCLIGTWGHNVYNCIKKSLAKWENHPGWMIDYVTKGSNFKTEHYSGLLADVPDSSDPSTQLNTSLIQTLQDADIIYLSGWASSHCLAFTVTDIADNFGEENVKKLVLLEDCTSPVPGFEQLATDFVNRLVPRGMQVAKSTDF